MKSLLPLALLSLACVAPLAAEAESLPPESPPANIHFRLTMLDTDAAGNITERAVETLAISERRARTHAGWRLPIATAGERSPGTAEAVPSVQYQEVGLALSLQGRDLGADRVHASGRVEMTAVDEQAAELDSPMAAPHIGTFSHHFEATLLAGQATTLVSVPRPDGGSVQLTLTASIDR